MHKGCTLVELFVVIATIAILAAVSAVSYVGFMNNARQSAYDQEGVQTCNVIKPASVATYRTSATKNGWLGDKN